MLSDENPLSWIIPRYRGLWRFRAPLSPGEIRRTERWLATARVALTIAAELALWMEPERGFVYSRWLHWLLIVYLAHGVVVMLLLRFRPQSTRAFRLVVHAIDIIWPVMISLFASAQHGPFFLFFVFVMAAAAYRWGLWETVGTAVIAVALLEAEAYAVQAGAEHVVDRWLHMAHLPRLGVSVRELDPQQLFMSSVYLMVLGFLLGYMSENQKKVRAERAVITRVLSSTHVEAGRRRLQGSGLDAPAPGRWRLVPDAGGDHRRVPVDAGPAVAVTFSNASRLIGVLVFVPLGWWLGDLVGPEGDMGGPFIGMVGGFIAADFVRYLVVVWMAHLNGMSAVKYDFAMVLLILAISPTAAFAGQYLGGLVGSHFANPKMGTFGQRICLPGEPGSGAVGAIVPAVVPHQAGAQGDGCVKLRPVCCPVSRWTRRPGSRPLTRRLCDPGFNVHPPDF